LKHIIKSDLTISALQFEAYQRLFNDWIKRLMIFLRTQY